jgi:hypothetical protein
MIRKTLQEFYDKVSGRTVYVIAGGPTVKNQNLELLKGKHVVCLNNAYSIYPDALALYWADETWAAKHIDGLSSHPTKFRFHSKFHVSNKYLENEKHLGIGNSLILKRTGDRGIDPEINNVRGNNSGAHILNLLYNCKVKKIVLLGYDMKIIDSRSHWHQGHSLSIKPEVYANLFIPSIQSMAEFFKRAGISVINTSTNSDLKCFPRMKLEDVV